MMSAKTAALGFLKITVFWNKGYDATIPVDDVTNRILWGGSNHIVYVFMWPAFGNSLAFLWEKLSQPQFYKDLTRETAFLWRAVLVQVR